MSIDVIIPVYHPRGEFNQLIQLLLRQTVRPNKIIILNTKDITAQDDKITKKLYKICNKEKILGNGTIDIQIIEIEKNTYDHGGTRHLGALNSRADYILFMTQDAVPTDTKLLENLILAVQQEKTGAAYARQVAKEETGIIETYTRLYNYPGTSKRKTKENLNTLGIKTYFCSNVCAIYDREVYLELGGFCKKIIFNEDMVFAAKLIQAGYAIAYAADAKVIHSHEYTCCEQIKRNFDLAVSQADHPEVFQGIKSESEGMRFVKQTVQFLTDRKDYYMAGYFLLQSAAKYLGYFLGKRYKILPNSWIMALTMNQTYWNGLEKEKEYE